MKSIDRLQEALMILKSLELVDTQLVAKLNWNSIPESYKLTGQWIVENRKVKMYNLGDNTILEIDGVGLFQTM